MLALVMAPLWGFPDYFGRGVHRTLTLICYSWFLAEHRSAILVGRWLIGSICLLGLFLMVDAPTNLFMFVEGYAKTAMWGILFAFPTVVLAYLLGLIAITGADAVIPRILKTGSA